MMRFDYFIILADMRTGSNFLESNLNALDGVSCFGEAFNPGFVGYPKQGDLFGISLDQREADPLVLIDAIKAADGLCGFRFFHNHDLRVLDLCLADPRCAKVVLTRNPLDTYVSLKIAQATGQWKLTNATHAKTQPITFDADEFTSHLRAMQDFQLTLLHRLQTTGQTAFFIGYDDLQDIDVLNGLAAFLGAPARLTALDRKLKKQNPAPFAQTVSNASEMDKALRGMDPFDLGRTPNFEPRKGPAIPTYVAAARTGLIHMPLRSGPEDAVADWLAALDNAPPLTDFSQKTLRQWQNDHGLFRRFTVLRHPVARAHVAFCDRILTTGPGHFPRLRATLRKVHKLPIPAVALDLDHPGAYDAEAHRTGFLAFLDFLRHNLAGQTSIRVDAAWASQVTLLQGMAQFALPDMILREEDLPHDLPQLAARVGRPDAPLPQISAHRHAAWLAAVYDPVIEAATRAAYARDYESFGFTDWR
ncbi:MULTISPECIES: sulfotransferase family 2 domain-containing protein [unclassified Yoonia]|uniref:sulfotransferase family 2 domain-containing protein n=1 Tax=unclassified Yoonia TaxID=2629118 RepID=UPI002AFDFEA7|nr:MULTISPECIES: sulfotransferase family 2 domain-containing protein [unclassified Yoonia]